MRRVRKVKTPLGIFDSKAEAKRFAELRVLEMDGKITDLQRQVVFKLEVNGVLVGRYTPDYTYRIMGELIVEEHKGYWTPVARLRVKLFQALYKDECRYVVSGTPFRRTRKDKGKRRE